MTSTNAILNAETITRQRLDNGLTILVYENHSAQSVVINGSLHTGSIYEDRVCHGLASMTSGSLMRGTINRDFETLHTNLEDIGADLGISSGVHTVSFSGKALAEDLPILIDILSDVLRNPVFPEDEVERLRGERLTWLGYQQQDTRWLANRAFRHNLYPDSHPYHFSPRGTLESIPAISVDAIHKFHRQQYGPRDMILVVVGDVIAATVIEVAQQYLGNWHNHDQPKIAELPPITAPTTPIKKHINVPGKTQSDVVIGTLGPARKEPDFQAANLANSILGQFGMMGRIGDVVREREGMAYYVYSQLDGGHGPGSWYIMAGVNPVNVDHAIELCVDEFRRLMTELVSQEDLDDNQSYFTGRLPLQLESNEGIAGTLHSIESYDLGLDYLEQYHNMIYAISQESILTATQNYINPDNLVITVAGPKDT